MECVAARERHTKRSRPGVDDLVPVNPDLNLVASCGWCAQKMSLGARYRPAWLTDCVFRSGRCPSSRRGCRQMANGSRRCYSCTLGRSQRKLRSNASQRKLRCYARPRSCSASLSVARPLPPCKPANVVLLLWEPRGTLRPRAKATLSRVTKVFASRNKRTRAQRAF